MTSPGTIVTVAIVARWLFCLVIFPNFLTGIATVGDQYTFDSYREIAAQLLAGNGYRVAPEAIPCLHRPPGYVAVLLVSFPASELAYLFAQFWNGLLGGLATWATITMGRLWGLSRLAASMAGYGVALWPFLVWETKITVPENLLVALLPLVFVALGRWRGSGAPEWLVVAGALAGLTTLTHGLYQVLLPALCLTILTFGDRPRRWSAVVVLCLAYGAMVTPWLVRNAQVAGQPMGVATGFGMHYLRGLQSWSVLTSGEPYFRDHDPEMAAVHQRLAQAGFDTSDDDFMRSDPATNRFLDGVAWDDVRARPGNLVLRAVVRAPLLWVQQQTASRSLVTALLLLPLFLLAARGLLRHWQLQLLGPFVTLVGLNLTIAAICPEAIPMRYGLPLMPLLCLFAARGLPQGAATRKGSEIVA
ncbi:MAG: hypothetical protein AAF657_09745 [Acidobacteriota bacterium]